MARTRYLDDDIVNLYEFGKPRKLEHFVATLFWGDEVREIGRNKVEIPRSEWVPAKGATKGRYRIVKKVCALPPKARFRDQRLLKVRFIDVGQGDGAIIETPQGQIVLIDGGEEEHLRRYMRVAYSHVLARNPVECDAIVVTHGDADHFAGLTRLLAGFRNEKKDRMATTTRVFHNGLVKRAGKTAGNAKTAFGRSRQVDGTWYATQLEDDLRSVSDSQMNKPFREWKAELKRLGRLKMTRLAYGDDQKLAFLQSDQLRISVLGPIVDQFGGADALRLLRTPGGKGLSASHTINGHSIVLKLAFGNVRFLFGADLNEESEDRLLAHAIANGISLAAEILKVPHHGSADFSPRMLEAVKPVVSVVSSGDESTAKEYIHPRAGLVGALGKYSRATVDKPLVYVTEMVAFMRRLGHIEAHAVKNGKPSKKGEEVVNAYQKKAFGIVHVRTDGERVLVATHSGKDNRKESYAFRVDERGNVTFEPKTRVL